MRIQGFEFLWKGGESFVCVLSIYGVRSYHYVLALTFFTLERRRKKQGLIINTNHRALLFVL